MTRANSKVRVPGDGPSEHEPHPHRRPANTTADRLRNLYQTGDESGQEPADHGETFSGLNPLNLRQ